MLIDATDLIVGRLGTVVAKKALLGEKIDIVNAEKAVVSGKRQEVLQHIKQKVDRRTWSKGPHYKRSPDLFLKRMIRNMLPFKKAKGKAALKNIMCWEGVPEQFKDQKSETIKEASLSKLPNPNHVSIKEISRFLGGKID
ncbi:50S ribosomal protein L13 [Candidatus Woesearchaeota archaeon]|jgi:large subunit ribosomal protein L13|nr:50S ribosomal protein L13 [Candidatus Woesearchaeota archaeon]